MTIENLKEAFQFAFKKNAETIYFKPEQINLIGESVKYTDNIMIACALSHGVYLLISKNNQSLYRFWWQYHIAHKRKNNQYICRTNERNL